MKVLRALPVALLATVALGGCETTDVGERPKQTAGVLAGAALGGLAGSQIGGGRGQLAATGAGVLLGALVGSEIGKSLDRADQLYAARATQTALEYNPTGAARPWRNPDTGHHGTVAPIRTYAVAGMDCRDYRHQVVIDGRSETLQGTACRQPDGTWRPVEQ